MPTEPLSAGLIDGGRMLAVLDAEIARLGGQVIENFNNHGDAKSACGKLTLTIDIKKHAEYPDHYEHGWKVSMKLPDIPGSVCLAVEEKGALCVQRAGSGKDSPKQESFLERPGSVKMYPKSDEG